MAVTQCPTCCNKSKGGCDHHEAGNEQLYQEEIERLSQFNDNQLSLLMEQAVARIEDESLVLRASRELLQKRGVEF